MKYSPLATISDNNSVTRDTLPVLERAADDDTTREEEDGSKDAQGTEVVLYVTPTVGASISENIKFKKHQNGNIVSTDLILLPKSFGINSKFGKLCLF